jgi:putative peptidoglycan lipid II flippase
MKTARTGGVVRAGAVMAVATLVSRVTGFGSKVVLLSVLGFGIVNDAYTLANTLPNIVFELLIGGVLTSVAIPLLSRARSDPDGGELYTQRLVTVSLVGLLGATLLAVAAAPLLTNLYLSGGEGTVDEGLATALAYLLLPQIFFYGIAALFGAILNTKEKFGIPAWAPVANNLLVIGVGVALHLMPSDQTGGLTSLSRAQYLVLGLGTTAGIVLQAAVMVPALLRTGFRFRWRWGGDRRLLEAGGLLLWAVAYVLVSQVGYIVTTNVASDKAGGITLYAFASMLFQLPYGIIGVSILTAIMPRMSRHAAAGQMTDVKQDAGLANRLSIVALTPIAAGMIVLATSLAVITSLYGAVRLDQTVILGTTLAALAFGLVPLAVTLVQMRVFYAMKDARTPTIINAIMVVVRVPLMIASASLDERLIVPGLALSMSLSYLAGAIAGEIWLRARYGPMGTRRTLVTLVKMTVAGAAGAAAALLVSRPLLGLEITGLTDAAVQIVVAGLVGLLVIAAVATLLKVEELVPVRNRLIGLLRPRAGRGPGGGSEPGPAAGPGGSGASTPTDAADHDTLVMQPVNGDPGVSGWSAMSASDGAAPTPGTVSRQSSSREQVSNPVPNDSGGPAVRSGEPGIDEQTARHAATGPDPGAAEATTVIAAHAAPDDAAAGGPDQVASARATADRAGSDNAAGEPPTVVLEPGDPTLRRLVRGELPPEEAEHLLRDEADRTLPVTESAAAARAAAKANPGLAKELTPGTTVGGRYRLVSLVTDDGAGHWFWRAKDTVLPRDMAVTMLPDTSGSSATVSRTLRAGRLHHIGLPQTLDVGTDHGQSYVVGQWVDGATLTDLVSGGPLDADVATSITAKLSEAVAEAHRNGIAFGALNPSLIRVNFDGQVRLSHVIAHGSATTDQDIRAIGALLYLMLTGTWPLGDPVKPGAGDATDGPPAAPTSLGRELPAAEINPAVPEALSALAERALHPEEPDGIHAVGAIAALLRSPDVVGPPRPAPAAEARPLSAADRRLIKERRVKLSLAAAVLAVFAVLIIIALGGLTNQVVASFQNSAPDELPVIDTNASSAPASPTAAAGPAAPKPSAASSSAAAPAAGPIPIVAGTVYDPQGDGSPDYKDYVDRAFDGNQESAWLTWVYKQQFPTLKTGVGLMLEFDREVTPTAVNIKSTTNGTGIEVRSATSPTATLDQTKVVGTGTVANGGVDIPLTSAPKSKYLLVFLTTLSPTPDNQFQGKINEVAVLGS